MALVFSRVGSVEECRGADELAEAPKAIEMSVVLWHEARCAGAEDLEGGAEDFEGAGAAGGLGREGFAELGHEGIVEELGREGIEVEALGL